MEGIEINLVGVIAFTERYEFNLTNNEPNVKVKDDVLLLFNALLRGTIDAYLLGALKNWKGCYFGETFLGTKCTTITLE